MIHCILIQKWIIILNTPITKEEVERGIRKLKSGKTPGKDGLPAEFFKSTLNNISPLLVILFNKIFESGDFPAAWTESIIVPVYKSGSRKDPNNYRGISLLNIMYKIFSFVIND